MKILERRLQKIMRFKNIAVFSFFVLIISLVLVYATTPKNDISDISEFGKITVNNNWKTVNFVKNYTNPVIIAKPITYNGGNPAHIRIKNVDSRTFQIKVEEWNYEDGTHKNETVSYMVLESGSYYINGKLIEVGSFVSSDSLKYQGFRTNFSSTPVVFTSPQTYNDDDAIVTRNQNVSKYGFLTKLQEEENSSDGGSHLNETIGYLAAEEGIYNTTTRFEVGKTNNSVTDSWYTINFNRNYDGFHSFLADMQTANGGNTAGLRYRNLYNSSVDIKVEEEQSKDNETSHCPEVVGYLVLEDIV